jgi:hypothetical protein
MGKSLEKVVHEDEIKELLIEEYVCPNERQYASVEITILKKKLHFWIYVKRPKYDPEKMALLKAKWKEEARQRKLEYKEKIKKEKEQAKLQAKTKSKK